MKLTVVNLHNCAIIFLKLCWLEERRLHSGCEIFAVMFPVFGNLNVLSSLQQLYSLVSKILSCYFLLPDDHPWIGSSSVKKKTEDRPHKSCVFAPWPEPLNLVYSSQFIFIYIHFHVLLSSLQWSLFIRFSQLTCNINFLFLLFCAKPAWVHFSSFPKNISLLFCHLCLSFVRSLYA